jgi:hypothetical protein
MSTPSPDYTYDPSLKKCTIRGVGSIPKQVFDYVEDIEMLDASQCRLATLPDNFSAFKNLKVVNFAHNNFTDIPAVLSTCSKLEVAIFTACHVSQFGDGVLPPSIRGITLTNNQLTTLPASIGSYQKLEKLTLAGNQLKALPHALLDCPNLVMLRAAVNDLQASPSWLFEHPRLAWYSDAANPFALSQRVSQPQTPTYPWPSLTIGEKVGESSKNTVFRGNLPGGEAVAVKLFGGSLSTDGTPNDDIAASLRAGDHPHLIGGIGKVVDGPDGQQGLVMPLVPATFTALGNPPSFDALVRDVYTDSSSLPTDFVAQVATDIASALQHLSTQGIMHGDIYAHNMLTDPSGHSYLGDFGAASWYTPGSADGKLRERVDVRGYGCLLDDLLSRCTPPDTNQQPLQLLMSLRDTCMGTVVAARPTFTDIVETLKLIK